MDRISFEKVLVFQLFIKKSYNPLGGYFPDTYSISHQKAYFVYAELLDETRLEKHILTLLATLNHFNQETIRLKA